MDVHASDSKWVGYRIHSHCPEYDIGLVSVRLHVWTVSSVG